MKEKIGWALIALVVLGVMVAGVSWEYKKFQNHREMPKVWKTMEELAESHLETTKMVADMNIRIVELEKRIYVLEKQLGVAHDW